MSDGRLTDQRRGRTGFLSCIAALITLACAVPEAAAQADVMRKATTTLPRIRGTVNVPALDADAAVKRDARGIVRIEATSIADAIRAQGFAHAQDRYFQMDLQRRFASGRLSELMGTATISYDRTARVHRFDAVAHDVIERLPASQLQWLHWYAEGVNAGLAALPEGPLEHAVLGVKAEPWTAKDTVLALLTMSMTLHFEDRVEMVREVAAEALPAPLVAFLATTRGRLEAPMIGENEAPPPVPGPDVIDLRHMSTSAVLPDDLIAPSLPPIGSNNWAVAGTRTADGRALVANDPHLPLTVPGLWYRMELAIGDAIATGVTYPGTPGLVIGSNGHVAWGFTNTTGDFQDHVVIEVDPARPDHYRTAEGWEPFEVVREVITVQGAAPVEMETRHTRWGPVVRNDFSGRPQALRWTMHDPDAIDFALFDLIDARTIDDAIAVARRWKGPSQNFVAGDRSGRIGWVVTGYLPRRVGVGGTVPRSWAEPGVGWEGALPESQRPMLVDPDDGILYTANNRTVDVANARPIGSSWAIGDRAYRIREVLLSHREPVTESDMLALQLDDRTRFYDWYRDLALELTNGASGGEPAAVRALMESWDGTAGVEQDAFAFLRQFQWAVHDLVLAPILAPCRDLDRTFRSRAQEEPVRLIVESRAPHLLSPRYDSWEALLQAALDRAIARTRRAHGALATQWGKINIARVHHPVTETMPNLGPLLNMTDTPVPGHMHAVRVQSSGFGASARFVASPGHEADGLLHIPAGQSGHPLSPYYRSSHEDWVAGRPVPLLAGAPQAVLNLRATTPPARPSSARSGP